MKKYLSLFALAALFSSFLMISCDDDDDEQYTLYGSVTTVNVPETENAPSWFPIGSEQEFYLTLDNQNTLYPSWINSFLIGYPLNTGSRAFATYYDLGSNKEGYTKNIQLIDIRNILTKPIYTLTADTISTSPLRGTAPIEIDEAWIGDDFINITFDYQASPSSIHYINLIVNQIDGPAINPENGSWYLQFVHDANGDTGTRQYSGIVAFKIPDNLTSVSNIVIGYDDFEGAEQSTTLSYPGSNDDTPNELGGFSDQSYQ